MLSMQGERHIILRAVRPAPREVLRGGPSATATSTEAPPPQVKVDIDNLDTRQVQRLTAQPDVVAIAPAMPMRLIAPLEDAGGPPAAPVPAPAAGTATWGVTAVGADTSSCDGTGIVVAVLDTGIDKTHPAFAGVNITEQDFTGAGNGDTNGHGTHCAGTIFGRDVAGTRIGIARGVTNVLVGKVIGPDGGASDRIASAIQWALDNGAHVISMSLGIDFPGYQQQLQASGVPQKAATSMALEGYRANVQLFERLASLIKAHAGFGHPTLVVAAAGNESARPDFVIAVSPPAVADGFISVAAIGQGPGLQFVVAPFSNTGANVAAPGVSVVSAAAGGGLRTLSGTSMATPHVAGVAALWAQSIQKAGPLAMLPWTARLIASGVTLGFAPGFEPADIGAGLIRAPQ
jgi:subtilisin family serine protease